MGNPNFEPIQISKSLGTKAKIKKLAELMKDEVPTNKAPVYLAIDIAINEAIARREAKQQ